VPRGTPGELCTRGYSVMLGYWNDPRATRGAIDAGRWMHTGDLATLDAEGYVKIVGRIKDMVLRGGENVFPDSCGATVDCARCPAFAAPRHRIARPHDICSCAYTIRHGGRRQPGPSGSQDALAVRTFSLCGRLARHRERGST